MAVVAQSCGACMHPIPVPLGCRVEEWEKFLRNTYRRKLFIETLLRFTRAHFEGPCHTIGLDLLHN